MIYVTKKIETINLKPLSDKYLEYIMNKFLYLVDRVERDGRNRFTLSFKEIEELIGEKLCPSAYKYKAYWKISDTHVIANEILSVGYIMEPNLLKLEVAFIKVLKR